MGWREETQAEVKDKTSGNRFKLDEGTNVIRILPSFKAVQNDNYTKYRPYLEYLVHKNVGPKKSIVRCGKDVVTKKGECWLCDEIVERYATSGKQEKRAVAKTLSPAKQYFMNIARWDKKTDSLRGPLKFYVPGGDGATSLAVKLLGVISGMGTSKQVDHPFKGCNVSITRTGTGQFDTRYGSPIPDEERSKVPKEILRKIESWSDLIPGYDENTQRSLFYGEEVQAMSRRNSMKSEENDDMPMKKKKKSSEDDEDLKKKKKKKSSSDDNNEENNRNEENENNNEEDIKKKKKKKKSSDDDNNNSDENNNENSNEENENNDDEPRKKKKKKKSKDDNNEENNNNNNSDNENEDEPVKKKKKKKKSDENNNNSDENNNDESSKKKKKKKKSKDDENNNENNSENENNENSDEENENNDDEPKKKSKKGKRGRPKGSKNKKSKDDENDDD